MLGHHIGQFAQGQFDAFDQGGGLVAQFVRNRVHRAAQVVINRQQVAGERGERLIVRGQANLIDADPESLNLERIRTLFDDLERKRDIADFLEMTETGEGVRIFIGSENKLFSLSGSTLVVSPYMNTDRKIIGAVGVIGPTRLNYGRIVPIVDYTAQLVGRMVSDRSKG